METYRNDWNEAPPMTASEATAHPHVVVWFFWAAADEDAGERKMFLGALPTTDAEGVAKWLHEQAKSMSPPARVPPAPVPKHHGADWFVPSLPERTSGFIVEVVPGEQAAKLIDGVSFQAEMAIRGIPYIGP